MGKTVHIWFIDPWRTKGISFLIWWNFLWLARCVASLILFNWSNTFAFFHFSICHNAIMFSQSTLFCEQIRWTIFLSEINSDHKLLTNVTTQVITFVTCCLNKRNFALKGEGRASWFCTVSYISCAWVCSFEIPRNTFKYYHKVTLFLLGLEN